MKKIFLILSLAALALGCSSVEQQNNSLVKPEVRFKDGKLKILQFTDVHWGNGESDVRIPQIIGSVVEAERPDILVFTGDVVTGGPVIGNWY